MSIDSVGGGGPLAASNPRAFSAAIPVRVLHAVGELADAGANAEPLMATPVELTQVPIGVEPLRRGLKEAPQCFQGPRTHFPGTVSSLG